jgi:epoxyqueuosine reductase
MTIHNQQSATSNRILLNVCCAPDATHSINALREMGYDPVTYFYNPNVHPYSEYLKRSAEMEKVAHEFSVENIVEVPWDVKEWFDFVKPFAKEKEGGKRCELCFKYRMEKSAQKAKTLGIGLFTTTLTISPHKEAKLINALGAAAGEKYGVKYLETDFKKKEGFKKSIELSKKHSLYRQRYCGCSYSLLESAPGQKKEP